MTITLCTSPPFPYIYVSGGLLRSMGFCMQGSQHAAGGDGDPACGGDEDPAEEKWEIRTCICILPAPERTGAVAKSFV